MDGCCRFGTGELGAPRASVLPARCHHLIPLMLAVTHSQFPLRAPGERPGDSPGDALPSSAHRHRLSCVCFSNTPGKFRMCSLQVFDCQCRTHELLFNCCMVWHR